MKKVWVYIAIFASMFVILLGGTLVLIYHAQTLSGDKLQSHARTLQIYDNSDKLIRDTRDTKPVTLSTLPDYVPNAFVAVEDKNFYKHKGVSLPRIAKATYNNIREGRAKEGASTISQQLIKNTHLSHEKTLKRKIREASLAHKLEKKYTKSEILEMYLNAVYFGNGIYGLEGASQFYFGKEARELTIRESASLAGILRSPSRYCPINNTKNFTERGDFVLRLMHDQNLISSEARESALSSPLEIIAKKENASNARSYKTTASIHAAKILDLSQSDLAAFGYRVFTYYNPQIQESIVKTVNAPDYIIKNESGNRTDHVIMSSNNEGEVTAFHTSTPTLVGARRNFASALKPLVVYTPALELGIINPSTIIQDEPYSTGDFSPKNHDNTHRGPVTVRESVTTSLNIPAVRVMDYTRLDRSIDIARRLGLELGLPVVQENMSLSLGNSHLGTSFEELSAGYSTLASGGMRVNTSLIKRIEDRDGNVVWRHHKPSTNAVGSDTAFLMTDMLRDVAGHGTAKKLSSLDFPVAAKTGTAERGGSTTNTDIACVAYTPNTTLIVWYGNASMKPENDLPKGSGGGGIASFVARDILRATHSLYTSAETSSFTQPDSIAKDDNGEYYSLRFPPPTAKPLITPVIDGRISDGNAIVWFTALESQLYEIYQNNSLMEVIKGKSGEYQFIRTAPTSPTEYHVKTKLLTDHDSDPATSNTIKLYPPTGQNAPPPQKKKHWFF